MQAQDLEEGAHLVLGGQAVELPPDLGGAIGSGRGQGLGPSFDPQAAQKLRLGQQGGGRGAFGLGRQRNGGKISVEGQVRLARTGQGIDLFVALERLKGVAAGLAGRRAIIDQQGRAAIGGQPGADLRAQGRLGRRGFEHRAHLAVAAVGRQGGGEAEDELAGFVQPDHPLGPALLGAHELLGRQAVQQLICHQDHRRAHRHGVQTVGPLGRGLFQALGLQPSQGRRHLDQPQLGGLDEPRNRPPGPQQIGHQSSVAGTHLDQSKGRGRSHGLPGGGRP